MKNNTKLTFDDVLIEPQFSTIKSRKDVDLTTKMFDIELKLPVISSNMDTVTQSKMAKAMFENGGIGCLHRFFKNFDEYKDRVEFSNPKNCIVSIGLGDSEFAKAEDFLDMGVTKFCIDVAHGASIQVAEQLDILRKISKDHSKEIYIITGNFGSAKSVQDFLNYCYKKNIDFPDAIKVGIGPGSACTTRIKTGCGFPQLSAIQEISDTIQYDKIHLIADGGMKTPGDIAKALAAGADFVMLGGMLAGTEETPGEVIQDGIERQYKTYRGSASKESYDVQGKDEAWRTAEGESFTVLYKGPVKNILQDIKGGLRSALTYTGSRNLIEFRERANFIQVSSSTRLENKAHGKGK